MHGMKAVMFAAQAIQSGDASSCWWNGKHDLFTLFHLRNRLEIWLNFMVDGLKDGLTDAYDNLLWEFVRTCATDYNITRKGDNYAIQSYERSAKACIEAGKFNNRSGSVAVPRKVTVLVLG
jgi:acetyl-CoA acetyltransferase